MKSQKVALVLASTALGLSIFSIAIRSIEIKALHETIERIKVVQVELAFAKIVDHYEGDDE